MARHRLAVLLGLLLGLLGLGEDEGRHFTLSIGTSQEVAYPLGTDLSISRRGVVDAFHLGDGRWQITALRAGFVVIDARDSATGSLRLPRLFVDVPRAADERQQQKQQQAPPSQEAVLPIPQWICAGQDGVTCDQTSGRVGGSTASALWFQQARAACLASARCYFTVSLSAAARAEWITQLRRALGDGFTVSATAAGSVLAIVESYCGKAGRSTRLPMADALSDHTISAGLAWFNCREDRGLPRYQLKTQLFLVESSAAQELGFDTVALVQGALPNLGQNHAQLLGKLRALEQERRATMIGEPVLRLTANQPAELASGGEFQVVEHALRRGEEVETVDRVEWKQHGLTLKILATPLDDTRVRLAFDMAFKSRSQSGSRGGEQALSLNSLKSEADLLLGAPTMAGVLDLSTSASGRESLPVLSKVPILGPLFQRSGEQTAKSRLVLWLQLNTDAEAQGELRPP